MVKVLALDKIAGKCAAAWRIYILHPIRQLGHAKNHEARSNSRKSRDARASESERIFRRYD